MHSLGKDNRRGGDGVISGLDDGHDVEEVAERDGAGGQLVGQQIEYGVVVVLEELFEGGAIIFAGQGL